MGEDEEIEELEAFDAALWRRLTSEFAKLDRKIGRMEDRIMATLQEVIDAVDQDKAAVEAAAARVTADLGTLAAQVANLQSQLDQGTGVTAEDLQSIKDQLDAVTGEAEAIDPSPAEPPA